MARPNRPRIAGQRRRPDDPTGPVDTTATADQPVGDTAPAPEVADSGVTQTTSGSTAGTTRQISAEESATHSDEKPGRVMVIDVDPDPADREADAAPVVASDRRVSVILSATLAVLIVLILAFAGILGLKAWRGQQAEDARNAAVAAGRKAAETALSYDYRSLDKNFAAARATMTPDFASKFDPTAKVAGELATKTKATVRAEVREVGVRDADADRVTLIIFVNQTTTSTITQGKPRVDLNRTRFTMVRNGDQWLVQEISGL
jgi:Mce-associated membrane protein